MKYQSPFGLNIVLITNENIPKAQRVLMSVIISSSKKNSSMVHENMIIAVYMKVFDSDFILSKIFIV